MIDLNLINLQKITKVLVIPVYCRMQKHCFQNQYDCRNNSIITKDPNISADFLQLLTNLLGHEYLQKVNKFNNMTFRRKQDRKNTQIESDSL
jgi:hypothetical protein